MRQLLFFVIFTYYFYGVGMLSIVIVYLITSFDDCVCTRAEYLLGRVKIVLGFEGYFILFMFQFKELLCSILYEF